MKWSIKQKLIRGAALIAVCIAGCASADEYLYRPNNPSNDVPGSMGAGTVYPSDYQTYLTNVVWEAHYGSSASPNPLTVTWSEGFTLGAVAVLCDCRQVSNPFTETNALLWTENFAVVNRDVQELSLIQYLRDNSGSTVLSRAAIRVGGLWYARVTTDDTAVGWTTTSLDAGDLLSTDWHPLTFTESSALSLDTGTTIPFTNLTGTVDAAGIYYDTMGDNRVRVREFEIAASRPDTWTVLYQPNFRVSEPDSLGAEGEDNPSAFQTNLTKSVWQAHYGVSGSENPDVIDWADGFTQGAAAILCNCGDTGNPFREENALVWTENFSRSDIDVQFVSELRFRTDNSSSTTEFRPAIRVNGSWYAADFKNSYVGQLVTTYAIYELEALEWHPITFTPNSALSLNTGTSVAFESLSGPIDAAGLYYDTMGDNRVRIREYTVFALLSNEETSLQIASYSSSALKLAVSGAGAPSLLQVMQTGDLVSEAWSPVGLSTNGLAPFIVTNLSYSVTEGSNRVVYVETTNSVGFFGVQ